MEERKRFKKCTLVPPFCPIFINRTPSLGYLAVQSSQLHNLEIGS